MTHLFFFFSHSFRGQNCRLAELSPLPGPPELQSGGRVFIWRLDGQGGESVSRLPWVDGRFPIPAALGLTVTGFPGQQESVRPLGRPSPQLKLGPTQCEVPFDELKIC